MGDMITPAWAVIGKLIHGGGYELSIPAAALSNGAGTVVFSNNRPGICAL